MRVASGTENTKTGGKLPELEGLRGLLASWVAITHLLCWCGLDEWHGPEVLGAAWRAFIYAQPAVDVFIILSGFAIFHLLNEKPLTWRGFMVGRVFRIVPVYWVCLLLASVMVPVASWLVVHVPWRDVQYLRWMTLEAAEQSDAFLAHLGWHAVLLHGVVPRSVLPDATATLLAPAWSISLEWQFYLVAPALSLLLRRWWWTVFALLAISIGVSRVSGDFANHHHAFLPFKLPLFLVGAASYWLERWLRDKPHLPRRFGLAAVATGLACAFIYQPDRWSLMIWVISFGVSLRAFGAAAPWAQQLGERTLMAAPIQWLGRISYSLYLLHWPLIILGLSLLVLVCPTVSNLWATVVMLGIGFPLILLAARGLNASFEVPLMRKGRELSRRFSASGDARSLANPRAR